MTQTPKFNKELAWVTGGSNGIGFSIVEQFKEKYRNVVSLNSGSFDLGDKNKRRSWLANQTEIPGTLVLNAAVNSPNSFEAQSEEQFQEILEVNLLANRDLLLSVLPSMKTNQFGRIVFISSLYSTRARVGRSAYSISKAGLEALARSIAVEYAKYGVLVNVVAPGFVRTNLTEKNNTTEEILKIESGIPLGRLGETNEIASIVSFLASERNTYLTGQTIVVDGGLSIL